MRQVLLTICLFALWSESCSALVIKNSLTNHLSLFPGDTQTSSIQLQNETDKPVSVNLYPSGYAYQANGETDFPDPSTQPRSNASWIELPIDYVVIPPHSDTEVFYTIHVPSDRSLIGSYWSLLLIEPDTVETKTPNESLDFQIKIKVRYAHQIVTDIGTGKPELKILNKTIEKSADGYVLHADFENTGNVYLTPKLTLKLFDSQGKALPTVAGRQEKVLPGSSIRFSVPLAATKEKRLKGFLLLDHGDAVLFGHRMDMQLPE